MAEKEKHTEFEYTYTYDQFTVFFYGGRVFVGKKDYPVGQCCVDILNLNDTLFDEINQRVKEFVPAAQNLLTEKTDSAAALAQERLNAVWDIIFSLPVYRENGRAVQLPYVPAAHGGRGKMGAGAGPDFGGLCQISWDAV